MIPSIIRFNKVNYNLSNKELIEIRKTPSGDQIEYIYKFNKYGRIISVISVLSDDTVDNINSNSINFIRDIDTDNIVAIKYVSPQSLYGDTLIELSVDDLALSGHIEVYMDELYSEYSVFIDESEMIITNGYETYRVRYNQYGQVSQVTNEHEQEVTSFSYDDMGRVSRIKSNCGGYYINIIYHLYDNISNIPVKTISLDYNGMRETTYILR